MNRIGILGLLLLISTSSFAHRLDFAIKAEGNDYLVQAWFDENKPVQNGDVSILSADGSELASGSTDDQGLFRWTSARAQDITVKIYAGLGHKISREITAAELQAIPSSAIESDTQPLPSPAHNPIQEVSESSPISLSHTTPSPTLYTTQNQFGILERMVLGFAFLFSAAAAWMSYRNFKKLSEIDEWLKRRER